jgi:hypothetical protein
LNCARFVVPHELDSARSHFIDPLRFQSLAIRKIARRRDDRLWTYAIEQSRSPGNATVMLALDQKIAAKILIISQQPILCRFAAVGHEQDTSPPSCEDFDYQRLIVRAVALEIVWREEDARRDIARHLELVSRAAKTQRAFLVRGELEESPM